jgi:hypothetical protein
MQARWAAMSADPVRSARIRAAGRDRQAVVASMHQGGQLRDAELISARWHEAQQAEAGARVFAAAAEIQAAMNTRPERDQGFRPDGSRVSEEFKHGVMARWQAQRDAFYGREPRRGQPVMASAGGVSPLIERIFGLD